MSFWDSHAHIYMLKDVDAAVKGFAESAVDGCICPAVDLKTSIMSAELAERYLGIVGSCIGIHPLDTKNEDWNEVLALSKKHSFWAVGETGLDYYREVNNIDIQKERFILHIELARELNVPLIVHLRSSASDCLSILKNYAQGLTVVVHCFTENMTVARALLDLGCFLSFSGIITFDKTEALGEIVKFVPVDRFLIETDTPYLSPEPHRGFFNHPGNLRYIAIKAAELKNLTLFQAEEVLHNNMRSVFINVL